MLFARNVKIVFNCLTTRKCKKGLFAWVAYNCFYKIDWFGDKTTTVVTYCDNSANKTLSRSSSF